MERQVWTVDMDDTIAAVEALFVRHSLSWAPVLESKRTIVGVTSTCPS